MSLESNYKNKTVLITGHTGFKGSWLSLWLKDMGAIVVGISIDIPTEPANFSAVKLSDQIDDRRLDIRDAEAVKDVHFGDKARLCVSLGSPGTSSTFVSKSCCDNAN